MAATAAGTTSSARFEPMSATSSYPISAGSAAMCCSPTRADVYPAGCRVWTQCRAGSRSVQPRWARPVIPLRWQCSPVRRAARLPEHTGAELKAWRNSTPWSARCWMFGVGTWCP